MSDNIKYYISEKQQAEAKAYLFSPPTQEQTVAYTTQQLYMPISDINKHIYFDTRHQNFTLPRRKREIKLILSEYSENRIIYLFKGLVTNFLLIK